MLPEATQFDPTVVVAAVGLIAATAVVAAGIPGSRVPRLNPLVILRG
jgi:hypothetical protein